MKQDGENNHYKRKNKFPGRAPVNAETLAKYDYGHKMVMHKLYELMIAY